MLKDIELNGITLEESREYMVNIGEKGFRGEQLFTFFNRNKGLDIQQAKVLPQNLRESLAKSQMITKVDILKRFDSNIDSTKKYLFLLEDKNIIEAVLMEYDHGFSVCISTQVGCRMGCSFCASTKGGLLRNLTPGEMLNQIYLIEKDAKVDISNIVLMGSGEPLDNYDNVLKFLNIIHEPKGHNISYRNITLSTCGVVPRIYDLAKENLPITLSISLHSPFDEYRANIMPIAKAYKIDELMKACRYYEESTGRRMTFEYTLIDGINDRIVDGERLVYLLRKLNAHINLIPLNPIKEYDGNRTHRDGVERFKRYLLSKNINTTIRSEKGSDISASCGQLRRDYLERD